MNNKVVILTGATSGIGLEVAKTLYKEGYHLILANRNMEKAEKVKQLIMEIESKGKIDLLEIDLSSFSSIESFSKQIYDNYQRIDVLINNAGVFSRRYRKTVEGFELSKGVNYLGTFYLTELLKEKMKASKTSKIINVSSVGCYLGKLKMKEQFFEKRVNSFTDYFNSKKANLIHTIELSQELKDASVQVLAADPGIVYSKIWKWRSGFGRFLEKIQRRIMKSASEGSKIIVQMATQEYSTDHEHILYSIKGLRRSPKRVLNEQFRKDFVSFTKDIISKHKSV